MAHWDAMFTQNRSRRRPSLVRKLHIGQSFTDVPKNTPYTRSPSGSSTTASRPAHATTYCPDANLPASDGGLHRAAQPAATPTSGQRLGQGNPYDWWSGGQSQFPTSTSDPFCRHVHYIFSTGVTTGCITTPPRQYCPATTSHAARCPFHRPGRGRQRRRGPLTYGPDPITGRSYSCNAGAPNLNVPTSRRAPLLPPHALPLGQGTVISASPTGATAGPAVTARQGQILANGFGLKLYGP